MNDAKVARPEGPVQPLVGRLRTYAAADDLLPSERADLLMAADNIESLDRAQAWAYEEVIPRLEAEIERLRADAERYRYVEAKYNSEKSSCCERLSRDLGLSYEASGSLSGMIDAALRPNA